MRELFAQGVFILTLAVVVALAGLFAIRHNPQSAKAAPIRAAPASVVAATAPEASATAVARGRIVFVEQACATCHSFEGTGNPRNSLDGVSGRLNSEELRMWIIATGSAAEELPASIARRKKRYQGLPSDDLNALVVYLSNTKTVPEALER